MLLVAASWLARADEERSIVVASTTSTQDSGLFEYLLPIFKHKTGITVKVIALGTGQALDTGRRGDADVVFVHAKDAELEFLKEGQSLKRYQALRAIKSKGASFISRGDRSGTNIAELKLWKEAGIDIEQERGPWYKSIGQGMGAASTWRPRPMPTCSPIARPGFILETRGTCRLWFRAISVCSTSTG